MADLPSDFWGGWIAVLTVVSLAGLTWALFSVYFSRGGDDEEQKALVWDENLSEGANAPPMWWFWLIFSALIFTVAYLILYPGFGSYAGVLRWSQGGHMAHSDMLYEETFGAARAGILERPLEALQTDPNAMASAGRVFKQNCAACHGAEAKGQANLFPNLTDADWQWGGTPAEIEQTIRNGRSAAMPAHGPALGETGAADIVAYLSAMSAGEPIAETDPGRTIFNTYCFACHGEDARGNPLIGAPNLTDQIWLYGGSQAVLTETVTNGRNGTMPAFGEKLDDVQIRLLVAWLTRESAP